MVNSQKTMKAARGSKQRTRLDLDERRKKLLDIGRDLFGKHSYDELSINDIAELAGVSKGLLYHYFSTKRDFYVETVREGAAEMLRQSQGDPSLSPKDQLLQSLDGYLRYVEANAAAYISLMSSGIGVDSEVGDIVEESRQRFIDRVAEQLGFKKMNVKQRLAVKGWVGFVEAVSLEWLKSGGMTRPELVQFLALQFKMMMTPVGLVSLLKGLFK